MSFSILPCDKSSFLYVSYLHRSDIEGKNYVGRNLPHLSEQEFEEAQVIYIFKYGFVALTTLLSYFAKENYFYLNFKLTISQTE